LLESSNEGVERYFFGATDELTIDGNLFVSGLTGPATVRFSGLNAFNFTSQSSVGFASESPVFLEIDVTNGPLDLDEAILVVDQGTVELSSGSDLIIRGGSNIRAGFGESYPGDFESFDGVSTGPVPMSGNSIFLDGENAEIRYLSGLVTDNRVSVVAENQITVDSSLYG